MGPTRVLYLLGTGATILRGWDEVGVGMAAAAAVEARSAAAVAGAVEVGSVAVAGAER